MNHPPAWYSKCSQDWRFNVATSLQAWMAAWSSTLAVVSLTLATWLKGDPSILGTNLRQRIGHPEKVTPRDFQCFVYLELPCFAVCLTYCWLFVVYLALLLFGFPSLCVFLWLWQFCVGCVLWDFSFVENPIFSVAFPLSDFLDIFCPVLFLAF
jgi:hypothetical protein